ncbi:hypothetical protein CROQUDRAFT_650605 [Cronartium quercuum f. sp. fusiforme G11]|uniref:Uncharacterized protein n=1 Tax=Cronartium quercuum f. sp. fusiforme G11 TaxID=708437 RepID=A0A9P6NXJ7_9BASI|nr:hypothetical protein CROQUDRAFT_650605 [Cronartium quercuum f. sp. fusiforme G11]
MSDFQKQAKKLRPNQSNRQSNKLSSIKKSISSLYNQKLERGIEWPLIEPHLSNAFLKALLRILQYPINQNHDLSSNLKQTSIPRSQSSIAKHSNHHIIQDHVDNRKRRDQTTSIIEPEQRLKRIKIESSSTLQDGISESSTMNHSGSSSKIVSMKSNRLEGCRGSRSPIFTHLVIGINSVIQRLENLIENSRTGDVSDRRPKNYSSPQCSHTLTSLKDSPNEISNPTLAFVFVCRHDISPPELIAHIPTTVAMANMTCLNRSRELIQLIELPLGSEQVLADTLGIRRAAALGLLSTTPGIEDLMKLIKPSQFDHA